ncbi:unnamed protein product [Symbiodinium sp. KB8]|nr:unnamed protein product [Symbiodinium sp. KB8]
MANPRGVWHLGLPGRCWAPAEHRLFSANARRLHRCSSCDGGRQGDQKPHRHSELY